MRAGNLVEAVNLKQIAQPPPAQVELGGKIAARILARALAHLVLAEQAGSDISQIVLRGSDPAAQRQGQRTDLQSGQHKCLLHCPNPLYGAVNRTKPKWPGGPMPAPYYARSRRQSVRFRGYLRLRGGESRRGAEGSAAPSAQSAWCWRPPP